MDGDAAIGCATMSFVRIVPTFEHPTGKRAHLMNVYTRQEYRRQGIARKMVESLIGSYASGGYNDCIDKGCG